MLDTTHRVGRILFSAGIITSFWFSSAQASTSAAAVNSSPKESIGLRPVLADLSFLQKVNAKILATHAETGVAYAHLTEKQERDLSLLAHEAGKCGGFEALPPNHQLSTQNVFGSLTEREDTNRRFQKNISHFSSLQAQPHIEAALAQVSENNLKATVELLSSFTSRFHKGPKANEPVLALKKHIESLLKATSLAHEIELVAHRATPQKSLRVRVIGSQRPQEVIVMGAHLDSINQEWFGTTDAPGSDDNASGSANLVEVLRILSTQKAPERSIEFMWYAGEEGGLLGSSEIAQNYKTNRRDVVAVLQLDMTLFPGEGEFTLGSMTDFTSAWLRSYLENLNRLYTKAKIIEDKCGYGCSDHASWHRQGYPTVMPFEASFRRMNQNIHTSRDVIDSSMSFRHSAVFSKIALAIALDLGNSSLRESLTTP